MPDRAEPINRTEKFEKPTADELIARHALRPHPEGGFYAETWRSAITLPPGVLPGKSGPRQAGTAIYYLLQSHQHSKRHRVSSDELWFHLMGDPLTLRIKAPDEGRLRTVTLGPTSELRLQTLVPAGHWQSAHPQPGPAGYAFMACVVVPGFDFQDFEMAEG